MPIMEGLFTSLIYDAAKMGGRLFIGKYGIEFNSARKTALKNLYDEFNRQQIELAFFSYSNLKAILFFDKKNINKFLLLLKQGTILEQDEYYINLFLDELGKPYPYDRNLAYEIISRFLQLLIEELKDNHELFAYITACYQNAKIEEILLILKSSPQFTISE